MVDVITAYCETRIAQLKVVSDEELQAEIDRPFKGGFNPDFDFDKWCAFTIKAEREQRRSRW